MKKRMIIMLISMGVLLSLVFGFQLFKSVMISKYMAAQGNIPISVSTFKVTNAEWASELKAVGSLRAYQGVNITTEMAGIIRQIYFTPGQYVQAGDILVQLNIDDELAQLEALEATAELAEITYKRDKAQYDVNAVSKATVDSDAANLKNQRALVQQQLALIAKKTISAPFSGHLGISQVYLGQYLNPGDPVVTLQALNPIYVDFYVPEQQLQHIKVGQPVKVMTDSFPEREFEGTITTINPIVDVNTRNIAIEATIPNNKNELLPGMFSRVIVTTGAPKQFLTVPQTAISYNPYGSIVYLVQQDEKDMQGKPKLKAQQKFVELGEMRGDQVIVLKGLEEGDEVVTSGQLKLKNNSSIMINNSVVPSNDANPDVADK